MKSLNVSNQASIFGNMTLYEQTELIHRDRSSLVHRKKEPPHAFLFSRMDETNFHSSVMVWLLPRWYLKSVSASIDRIARGFHKVCLPSGDNTLPESAWKSPPTALTPETLTVSVVPCSSLPCLWLQWALPRQSWQEGSTCWLITSRCSCIICNLDPSFHY